MNRRLLLGLLVFFAVAGFSLLGDQPQAMAHGCHGWWGGGGYYAVPAYGGCYSYSYTPVVVHRPLFSCYRWYGCGGWFGCRTWCGCGGCYGYTTCYDYAPTYAHYVDDCGGCTGMVVANDAIQKSGDMIPDGEVTQEPAMDEPMVAEDQPAAEEPVEEQPAEEKPEVPGDDSLLPPKPPAETSTDDPSSAMINVRVPEEAVVVINDYTTRSKGLERSYVSRGLKDGREYRFEVRADVKRDGRTLSQTRVVRLQATKVVDLVFDFDAPQVAQASH
jgi:uncharacterized protein (TIGR03000 family)